MVVPARSAVVEQRFCAWCGAALGGETEYCRTCGEATGTSPPAAEDGRLDAGGPVAGSEQATEADGQPAEAAGYRPDALEPVRAGGWVDSFAQGLTALGTCAVLSAVPLWGIYSVVAFLALRGTDTEEPGFFVLWVLLMIGGAMVPLAIGLLIYAAGITGLRTRQAPAWRKRRAHKAGILGSLVITSAAALGYLTGPSWVLTWIVAGTVVTLFAWGHRPPREQPQ